MKNNFPIKALFFAFLTNTSSMHSSVSFTPLIFLDSKCIRKNCFFFQKQLDIQLFISPTMSKHRFSFLSSVMPFDDLEKRRQLWGTDRFAAARALTNIFKSLNDAQFPFTYQVIPYCRKPVGGNGPYYLNATEDYMKHLSESMPESSMKGRNIFMDRLYTSISKSNWLLTRNIISVGTLVFIPVGLPDEIKDARNRNEFENVMHWEQEEGNLALCAYTTKSKSKGKKNVLVLSTLRPLMGITWDNGMRKPVIIKFYDFTKGGIDILAHKIS